MRFIALILVLAALNVRGQNAPSLLEPCDFSQSLSGWHGDGAVSSSTGNPLAPPPSGPVTLDIALSSGHWCKIVQDFSTKYPTLHVVVQYKVTPDTTFSTQEDDYSNVTHAIGFDGWKALVVEKGRWILMMSDFSRQLMTYYQAKPVLGSDQVQSYRINLDKVDTSSENKTLTLAFPPGQGTVSILSVVATP